MPALVLESLVVGYGAAPVISDLSLAVGDSERVGLFGPNGHGKTTLLRTISGVLAPADGSICLFGQEIIEQHKIGTLRQCIVHVQQSVSKANSAAKCSLASALGAGGIAVSAVVIWVLLSRSGCRESPNSCNWRK
jgi:ABC-type branched-subunit amino acid transport system ATPase component